jgi:hypothetical protein
MRENGVVEPNGSMGDRPRSGHTQVEREERVAAEYLRMWGLRDPSTIATHCRRFVRYSAFVGDDSLPGRDLDDRNWPAVRHAMNDIDLWLDHLTQLASPDPRAAPLCRGLLAMQLQKLLDEYPTAMLSYERVPVLLAQRLQRASRPVVPTARLTNMPAQPLNELAAPLRFHWWRRVILDLFAAQFRPLRLPWFR